MKQRVIFPAWWFLNQFLGSIIFITQSNPLPSSSLPRPRWGDRLEGPHWSRYYVRLPKHAIEPRADAFLYSPSTGKRGNCLSWTSCCTPLSTRPTGVLGQEGVAFLPSQHTPGPRTWWEHYPDYCTVPHQNPEASQQISKAVGP